MIVASGAAVLVAAVAFGHVLNPQFLLWLVPLVFVLAEHVGIAAALGWVVLAVLTNVWYPRGYASLALESQSDWIALVAVRDAGLVALELVLVVAVVPLVARQE